MEKKKTQEYVNDINEIRSIMERSTKFMPLSGWAGIFAGIYALIGSYLAFFIFDFQPDKIFYNSVELENLLSNISTIIYLALIIFILALGTTIFLSIKKASKKGESIWIPASKRLIINMAVPLIVGGIFILVIISHGLIGLVPPLTLLFYGLALFNAGKFTYNEVRILGLIQIILGLISSFNIELGIFFWAIGFGFVHILYGIYMHIRYER